MKKSLIVLPVLFLAACSQANGDGGVYHRVGQTAFEQQHGMSSALVIADDEQSAYIENSWAKNAAGFEKSRRPENCSARRF